MINNYVKIDSSRSTELQVIRKGFFKPVYTLTEGQFEYGTLSCGDIFRLTKIETADGNWLLKKVGFLGMEVQIIDEGSATVTGRISKNSWETKTTLEMDNGFIAMLKRRTGFFSRQISWTNDQLGDTVKIISTTKFTKPFIVTINESLAKTTFPLALITLIGVNIILQN